MEAIQNIFRKISGGDLGFNIDGSSVAPNYLQALGIIFFLFLLLLVLAKMVRGYMSWYAMGWYIWVFLGFSLALVIEGYSKWEYYFNRSSGLEKRAKAAASRTR